MSSSTQKRLIISSSKQKKMSSPEDFKQFLKDLSQEGRYFETSRFTLDSLKAREKLSQFQLADSGLWLVKLVQGAVSSGALKVVISFQKRKVSVSFENSKSLKAEELLKLTLSGQLPKDPTLLHLVTGLRANAASVNESISWSCGGTKVTLNALGSSSEPHEDQGLLHVEAERPSRNLTMDKILLGSVSQLLKQTVEEYDAVRSRCWVSPIPILLDGKELERSYHHPDEMQALACLGLNNVEKTDLAPRLPYFLNSRPERDQSYPFSSSSVSFSLKKPVWQKELFVETEPRDKECKGILALFWAVNAKSSLYFVLHGAVVKRVKLEKLDAELSNVVAIGQKAAAAQCALQYFVAVDTMDLDMSHFNIRNLDTTPYLKEILPCLKQLSAIIKNNRKQFYYVPAIRTQKAFLSFSAVQLTALTMMTKGIGLIPLSGIIPLSLLSSRSRMTKQLDKFMERAEGVLES